MALPRNNKQVAGEGGVALCKTSTDSSDERVERPGDYEEYLKSVKEFLKLYKPLECECCKEVLACVERKTRRVFCQPTCMMKNPPRKTMVVKRNNIEREEVQSGPQVRVPHRFGASKVVIPAKIEEKKEGEARIVSKKPLSKEEAMEVMKAEIRADFYRKLAPDLKDKKMTELYDEETRMFEVIVPFEDKQKKRVSYPNLCAPGNLTWKYMKYSPNLIPGMNVRVTYSWAINKYHVVSIPDEDALEAFSRKVGDYVRVNHGKTAIRRLAQPDDIVIAVYGNDGEFYRARVMASTRYGVEVDFIDYGDQGYIDYSDIYEITEELFKVPVFGLKLRLMGVPDGNYKGISIPKQLQSINAQEFILDLLDEIEPDKSGEIEGKLWLGNDSVNEIAHYHLLAQGKIPKPRGIPRSFKIVCQKSNASFVDFMFPCPAIKNVKRDVLKASINQTTVAFDAHSYTKKFYLKSVPTWQAKPGEIMKIEISRHPDEHYGASVVFSCIQLVPDWIVRRRFLSKLIRSYITQRYRQEEGQMETLKTQFAPERDQMFLVKYPSWREVSVTLKRGKGQKDYDEIVRRGYYDDYMLKYGEQYVGQWFRAAFVRIITGCTKINPQLAVFNLIDIGRRMIIPAKNVYAITPRFLVPPQLSLNIAVSMDGISQYTPNFETWLKSVLTPGHRTTIRAIASVSDVTMAQIIFPKLFLDDFTKWEAIHVNKMLRSEIESKLKKLIDQRLDLRDVDQLKQECQKLLNQLKLEYAEDLANNRYIYGTDQKKDRYRAGGLPVFMSTILPQEQDEDKEENAVQLDMC